MASWQVRAALSVESVRNETTPFAVLDATLRHRRNILTGRHKYNCSFAAFFRHPKAYGVSADTSSSVSDDKASSCNLSSKAGHTGYPRDRALTSFGRGLECSGKIGDEEGQALFRG